MSTSQLVRPIMAHLKLEAIIVLGLAEGLPMPTSVLPILPQPNNLAEGSFPPVECHIGSIHFQSMVPSVNWKLWDET